MHQLLAVCTHRPAKRGAEDILIACDNGIKDLQRPCSLYTPRLRSSCIIHQIRKNMRHVDKKNKKAYVQDLTPAYKSVNKGAAKPVLGEQEQMWVEKYPL